MNKSSKKQNVKGKKGNALEQKVQELTTDLQQVQADFANYKRRTQEDQEQIMTMAKEAVILQLLPLIDNLERALSHSPKAQNHESRITNYQKSWEEWAMGVEQVAKQTEAVLKALGVEKILAHEQPFDPHFHEAIGYEEGIGDNEVVTEQLQTGYKIGNRVIRPAMVKVGKSPKPTLLHPEQSQSGAEGSNKDTSKHESRIKNQDEENDE